MSDLKLIIVVIIGVLLTTVVVVSVWSFLIKQRNVSEAAKYRKFAKRFRFYNDFVLSRQLFRKIFSQINMLSVYSLPEARIVTVQFFERAVTVAILFFVVGFFGLGDLISGVVLAGFAAVLINSTVNKRIDNVNFECLKATSALCLSIRESYTRVRNVPDALNDAKCPPILQRILDQIYMICTANDANERLNRFYDTCPNRILKTLATTCYIRTDVGEEGVGKSPFKEGIGLISEEVNYEVRRQINQRLMFSTLDRLPFIPLALYPFIRAFYVSMISATAAVFESGVGYMIKLVNVLASFICYYVLSTMNNASVARTDDRLESIANLMKNVHVAKFAKMLVPREFRKRRKFEEISTGCLSSKSIDYFYLERFIFGAVAFVLAIIFSIIITYSARQSIYNSLHASTMTITLTYTPEQKAAVTAYDAEVLAMDELPPAEEMHDRFKDIFVKASSVVLDTQVERLQDKYTQYHNMRFQWWYSVVYICTAIAGWFAPLAILLLRAKLVKSEAEMDVMQLQTVIAILMDTTLDTSSVLYWLSKSSDIHKDILTYCYHDYWRDSEQALKNLKRQSTIPEFAAICEKLITTIHQVSLGEAFEDLIAERDNTMRIRDMYQTKALQDKRNIAGPIATAPMIVWLFTVFILPIGIVAVKSAISMLGNLKM